MVFGFYNRTDRTEEIINRKVGFSRLEAAKYFALMPKAKPLSQEMIVAAMNKTKSNKAAARYLNVLIFIIRRGLNL
jgi:predicted transcriptional regulator